MKRDSVQLLPPEVLVSARTGVGGVPSFSHGAQSLLHLGTFAIGAAAVIGFFLDSSTVAGVLPGGRPVAAITGVALMVLCFAAALRQSSDPLRSRWGTGVAAIAGAWALAESTFSLIDGGAASLTSASGAVPLHPYPVTSAMFVLLAVITLTTSRPQVRIVSHILASAVLLSGVVFVFGVVYEVPWFVDENVRIFPVLGTTIAFLMFSAASLLADRIGWVTVILSDTSAGRMSRLLLPATIAVPLLTALAVHARGNHSYLSKGELTIVVAVNMLCVTALVLAGGASMMRGEAERRRLAAIVESSTDAIYANGVDGTLQSWNRGAEQIYGYTAKEAMGASNTMLLPADERLRSEMVMASLLRGEQVEPFETVRVRKDGTSVELSMTMSPIRNSVGAIEGVATIGRDIGAQKAAARALVASEAMFRSLSDANILGIMFWSVDGTVVDANDEFLRLTGYSRSDLQKGAVSWATLTPPASAEESEWAFGETLSVGWLAPFEKECLRMDGGHVPVIFGAAAASETEGIAFLLDITDRKRAERLQAQLTGDLERAVAEHIAELQKRALDLETMTSQLVRSNRELEAFTYSVSHDLRAPLRAMDGFSRILMEEYREQLDERGASYLTRIRKATERMSLLIDDLLSLSRINRHEIRMSDVDLTALVRGIVDELANAEPDRRVSWNIAEGVSAEGDASLLRIALQNLLGNAWKFTAKQPQATIEFGCDSNGEFFVRDDGAGFDPRHANKLFVPFQRLHSSSEFEGTGIGLALVERIINRHGGTVRAQGAPGHGATFWFSLGEARGAVKC